MGEIDRNNDASRVSVLSHSAVPGPEPRNHAFSLRFPTNGYLDLLVLANPCISPRQQAYDGTWSIALTIFSSKGTTKIQTHGFEK